MWDASSNNGNIFWTPTIRAFDFIQESDEERIKKFQDNPILVAFLEKHPNAIVTQELKYDGKYMYYTHTNGTMTIQLRIWDTGHNVHFGFSCHNTKTGLDFNQGFIKNAVQLNSYNCE